MESVLYKALRGLLRVRWSRVRRIVTPSVKAQCQIISTTRHLHLNHLINRYNDQKYFGKVFLIPCGALLGAALIQYNLNGKFNWALSLIDIFNFL